MWGGGGETSSRNPFWSRWTWWKKRKTQWIFNPFWLRMTLAPSLAQAFFWGLARGFKVCPHTRLDISVANTALLRLLFLCRGKGWLPGHKHTYLQGFSCVRAGGKKARNLFCWKHHLEILEKGHLITGSAERGAWVIFLSSFLIREEGGRLGHYILGSHERFYWFRQTCRGPDSVVTHGGLHLRRVTSVIRGLIRAAEVGNHSISLLALMRSDFFFPSQPIYFS